MWQLKMAAKLMLSNIGLPYSYWRKIGLFRHGMMDRAEYASKIFKMHTARAYPDGLLSDRTILEIGPGDSLASAILGFNLGVKKTYLVDAGRYAIDDISFYKDLALQANYRNNKSIFSQSTKDINEFLADCSAVYMTDGVNSLAHIPDKSVDLIWSHSVLEHIPLYQLDLLLSEMRRIIKDDGYISHNIDFQDHLSYSLNNLRFSERFWESAAVHRSGFYTNRVRALSLHEMIEKSGFKIIEENFGKWPKLPLPKRSFDLKFRSLSDQELLIRTSHILARPI